jgi:hypothetical protein
MVIAYREHDGSEGIALEGSTLTLYHDGAVVAQVEARPSAGLHELMLGYEVPGLFPAFSFCLTEPQDFDAVVSVSPVGLSGELMGLVDVNGEEHMWVARYAKHPDFRRSADEIPEGARPWADDSDGQGWEFLLPAAIQTHPDVLVPKRLALLLEAFVEDVAAGRDLPIPYRRRFDNVFSVEHPAWRLNLPRLISVEERGALDYV